MSYHRVIPRDLFNEAKLLKCLGKLVIASERFDGISVEFELDDDDHATPFRIERDPNDGSIFVGNIDVFWLGRRLACFTPLNSKLPYPLCAQWGDTVEFVFDDHGGLADGFKRMCYRIAGAPRT
jgi:hypothetical protein